MPANTVRIISGKWRGRKLKFPSTSGLRPSGDRTRETVFNWLAPYLTQARCLDLFAGSGALGFEAASRGAASVDLVEQQPLAARALRTSRQELDATTTSVYQREALRFLRGYAGETYDLVFIDPPFDGDLAARVLALLGDPATSPLSSTALIYLEQSAHTALADAELATWYRIHRDKRFGDSRGRLLEWSASSTEQAFRAGSGEANVDSAPD